MADEHSNELRAALSAAFDADTSTTDGAGTESASAEPVAAEQASSQAARDTAGRYAAKDGQAGVTDGSQGAAAAPDMPEGYDADTWAVMTPQARASMAGWAGKQREGLAERDTKLKGYEGIDRVLTQQRRDALTMEFGGVDQALDRIFQLSDLAGRDPHAFLRMIAQQRGIDLASLAPQQRAPDAAQQQGRAGAPNEMTAQQYVQAEVKRLLDEQSIDTAYQQFLAIPDLPHRDHPGVKRVMVGLLTSGAANDYRKAYDMAVHADPDVGPKQRMVDAAIAAKADTARSAETARSKASAAVSTVGGPGTSRLSDGGSAPSSVRAALETAWSSQAGARA